MFIRNCIVLQGSIFLPASLFVCHIAFHVCSMYLYAINIKSKKKNKNKFAYGGLGVPVGVMGGYKAGRNILSVRTYGNCKNMLCWQKVEVEEI